MIAAFSPALDGAAFLATLVLGGILATGLLALAAALYPARAHAVVDHLEAVAADPADETSGRDPSPYGWPFDYEDDGWPPAAA